jgi:hypothetical protein
MVFAWLTALRLAALAVLLQGGCLDSRFLSPTSLDAKVERLAAASVELQPRGERPFDAAVTRPRAFDAKKKYPVILQVYAGSRRRAKFDQATCDELAVLVSAD